MYDLENLKNEAMTRVGSQRHSKKNRMWRPEHAAHMAQTYKRHKTLSKDNIKETPA